MQLEFKDEFFKKLEKLNKKTFLKKLTKSAGISAVNFSKERFRENNWAGKTKEPWQARKKNRKRENRGSLMLVSGRLKRSIRKIGEGNYYVMIGTDVPYAKIHNEGGTINKTVTVRSHQRKRRVNRGTARVKQHQRRMNLKIPKRQFMGESAILAKRLEKLMKRKINQELRSK